MIFRCYVLYMNLLSYNIRGLGGVLKKKEVAEVIRRNKSDIIGIQETKMVEVECKDCETTWGSSECNFMFKALEGRLRVSFRRSDGMLGTGGCSSVNCEYAPCDAASKRGLWKKLSDVVRLKPDARW